MGVTAATLRKCANTGCYLFMGGMDVLIREMDTLLKGT